VIGLNVTIWNEFEAEQKNEEVKKVYPQGIHSVISEFLKGKINANTTIATLQEPEHGLTEEVLANTDVLIWWAHLSHDKVSDEVAERVQHHVLQGMGLIVLHSGHHSKPFKKLIGTTGNLRWREDDCHMRIWTIEPSHPIAKNVPMYIDIPRDEMYGERFDIPAPDSLVFISWFPGGEVMRSGCCFTRGAGKIFYFQPGHETYPVYKQPEIQTIICNAVNWAHSGRNAEAVSCIHAVDSPESLRK